MDFKRFGGCFLLSYFGYSIWERCTLVYIDATKHCGIGEEGFRPDERALFDFEANFS